MNERKTYEYGRFVDYGVKPEDFIKSYESKLAGTSENGSPVLYSAGENIVLKDGKISAVGGGSAINITGNDVE